MLTLSPGTVYEYAPAQLPRRVEEFLFDNGLIKHVYPPPSAPLAPLPPRTSHAAPLTHTL
jgi:hypothetical protein